MTKRKYILILALALITVLFSCKYKATETYSLPDNEEINRIVWTVITEENLPVLESLLKTDTTKCEDGKKTIFQQTALPICTELRKIKVIKTNVVDHDISSEPTPPLSMNVIDFSDLFCPIIDGKSFFDKSDSLYFLFQNDTLKRFAIADTISNKIIPTTISEQMDRQKTKEYIEFYDLSIPIFSKDMTKAYIQVTDYCFGLCGGAYALYLIKKNGKWVIIYRHQIWIS